MTSLEDKIKMYEPQKSSRPNYDFHFCVSCGDDNYSTIFTFWYKEQPNLVSVLGQKSGSTSSMPLDDEDEALRCAHHGSIILPAAEKYLQDKFHKPLDIEPKEYHIGGNLVWKINDQIKDDKNNLE